MKINKYKRYYHNNLNKFSNKLSNNQRDQYIFFDDLLSNLEMAKKLGWKTIWIHPNFHKKII